MPAENEALSVSEMELLLYIKQAEDAMDHVPLSQIFTAAVDHPASITQKLESLCDQDLVRIEPAQDEALTVMKAHAQNLTHLHGPTWQETDERLAQAAAQRGIPMNAGDLHINAGMAVIAFNRAMQYKTTPEERAMLERCHLKITQEGQEKLAALDSRGASPSLDHLKGS